MGHAKASHGTPQVLIVENSVPGFITLAGALTELGHPDAVWKTSGWQVTQLTNVFTYYDVILLNIHLPGEDTAQTLRKIRRHPRLASTIIIATSDTPSAEEVAFAQSSGFDGYMALTLPLEQQREALRRILESNTVWLWEA